MKISLIVTTYNNAIFLDNCLHSISCQVEMPYEIIIADDGSSDNTREVVQRWKSIFRIPFKHVWQEDKGFRLARVRNLAMSLSSGDYLIIIDGDVILNKFFVQDHHEMAKKGYFVCGSRVILTEKLTRFIQVNQLTDVPLFKLKMGWWTNALRCFTLRHLLAPSYDRTIYKVRGCNMAFWKTDVEKVNGFDENFVGWGFEDTDFAVRLYLAGVKKLVLKFGGVQYHQYHKERKAVASDDKRKHIQRLLEGELPYFCTCGLNQHKQDNKFEMDSVNTIE